MAKNAQNEHSPHCTGHIDCPKCGPDQCARSVVADQYGRAHVVVCCGCWTRYDVTEEDGNGAEATPQG